MLAPPHGPIEQCSPFNGLNIEICMILLDVGIKKSFRIAIFQHNLRNGRYMICVALTTCVFQSISGCGTPTDSRVQVIVTYRRNYTLAIKHEVIIAFHWTLHGVCVCVCVCVCIYIYVYIYIYIYIYLVCVAQRCYQICEERCALQDIRWAVDELLICNAN